MKTPDGGLDSTTVLAETQARRAELCPETIEVRDRNGVLVGRVDRASASELIARRWAEPIGGARPIPVTRLSARRMQNVQLTRNSPWRYLRLTKNAPSRGATRWMSP